MSQIIKQTLRIAKTFFITFVAVFALLNIPSLYANAKYYVSRLDAKKKPPLQESIVRPIAPVSLPVAAKGKDSQEQEPLPNEATLRIDKIGVSVPIVFGVSERPDQIYTRLMDGIVHYSPSVKPGEKGFSVLLGHSAVWLWQRNPNAASFALLDKLEPGDEARIKYGDGREYVFVIRKSIIFNPLEGDNTELTQLETTERPSLALVSCYPPGNAKNRIATVAECINCSAN